MTTLTTASVPAGPDDGLRPADAPTLVSVRLLGGFQVSGPDARQAVGTVARAVLGARDLGGGKPRQIFAILALEAGRVVSKERLIELLWPERAPADAQATLESYVSVLRNHLLAVCASRTGLVRTAVAGYMIERHRVELDIDRFASLVGRAEDADPHSAHRLLQEALAMAQAPLLVEDSTIEWADDVRRTHARRVTSALVTAAEVAGMLGHTERALECADRALAAEPHNEAAWAALLRALEHAGRHADALREYGECRRVFDEELGCAPGPVIQDVLPRLLSGAAETDAELGDLLAALLRVRDHVRDGAAEAVGDAVSLHASVGLLEDLLARARPLEPADAVG